MKLKAREFIENLEPRSIPLFEKWTMQPKGVLAVYTDAGNQKFTGTVRLKKSVLPPKLKFRLEPFDANLLGNVPDDSVYGVIIGPLANALTREETEAYTQIDFFESTEEIAELCHEALER